MWWWLICFLVPSDAAKEVRLDVKGETEHSIEPGFLRISMNAPFVIQLKVHNWDSNSEPRVDSIGRNIWQTFFTELGLYTLLFLDPSGHEGYRLVNVRIRKVTSSSCQPQQTQEYLTTPSPLASFSYQFSSSPAPAFRSGSASQGSASYGVETDDRRFEKPGEPRTRPSLSAALLDGLPEEENGSQTVMDTDSNSDTESFLEFASSELWDSCDCTLEHLVASLDHESLVKLNDPPLERVPATDRLLDPSLDLSLSPCDSPSDPSSSIELSSCEEESDNCELIPSPRGSNTMTTPSDPVKLFQTSINSQKTPQSIEAFNSDRIRHYMLELPANDPTDAKKSRGQPHTKASVQKTIENLRPHLGIKERSLTANQPLQEDHPLVGQITDSFPSSQYNDVTPHFRPYKNTSTRGFRKRGHFENSASTLTADKVIDLTSDESLDLSPSPVQLPPRIRSRKTLRLSHEMPKRKKNALRVPPQQRIHYSFIRMKGQIHIVGTSD